MDTVKVTRKYQVTIPQKVREKTGIKIGDELMVNLDGRKVTFEKPVDLDGLAGSWGHIDSTERFMEEVRKMWETWKLR